MKLIFYFMFLMAFVSCTDSNEKQVEKVSSQNRAQVEGVPSESKQTCADKKYCEDLRISEEACASDIKNDVSCRQFVMAFQKLSVIHDCQRSFDTEPVPSIWICDEGESGYPSLLERSAKTLSKLNFKFAKDFYGSDEFRSVLDGDLAETHLKPSLNLKKKSKISN